MEKAKRSLREGPWLAKGGCTATETNNSIDEGEKDNGQWRMCQPAIIRAGLAVSFLIILVFGQGLADCRGSRERAPGWRPGVSGGQRNNRFSGSSRQTDTPNPAFGT